MHVVGQDIYLLPISDLKWVKCLQEGNRFPPVRSNFQTLPPSFKQLSVATANNSGTQVLEESRSNLGPKVHNTDIMSDVSVQPDFFMQACVCTCTNSGIVCMLAISPLFIGSLARMWSAPVQPSTISSIRTPS